MNIKEKIKSEEALSQDPTLWEEDEVEEEDEELELFNREDESDLRYLPDQPPLKAERTL